MKKSKILLIFTAIILIISGCKPHVERTQADKAYYEYCIIYVELFSPDKISENWDEKRIDYLTSNNFEVKYEKLKEAVENYEAVMTDKNSSTLENITRHIETTDKFLNYAKKYKETGKYKVDEITESERLDRGPLQSSIGIAYDAMLTIIDAWEKTTPVYVD